MTIATVNLHKVCRATIRRRFYPGVDPFHTVVITAHDEHGEVADFILYGVNGLPVVIEGEVDAPAVEPAQAAE